MRYVALLRAVNVGGTGKLAMADLTRLCEAAGFRDVKTYIASGNVVFASDAEAETVKRALEAQLRRHAGKTIGVIVRTADEMAAVSARNPFPDAPGHTMVAIFLDGATSHAMLESITGQAPHEEVRLGAREIYVRYGAGMGTSKLKIPAATTGTARNMNTVARLAAMAAG